MRSSFCTLIVSGALGCGFEAAFERATDHDAQFASQGDSQTALTGELPDEPGGPDGPGVQTVTGEGEGEGESTGLVLDDTGATSTNSTGPGEHEAVIHAWTADQLQIWAPGPVELTAVVDERVTAVDVYQGDDLVTTLHPPALTYTWEVLGELQDGQHTWSAVARTASAASAPAQLVLEVDVPAGGLPLWYETAAEGDLSLAAAVATADGASIVVGYVAGALTLRRYDDAEIAWTRSVTDWSKLTATQGHTTGTDAAIDGDGNLIVAGNVLALAGSRRYLAKLTPTGGLLWERIGAVGEVASGVSVDDEGRIYLAGAAPVAADTKLMVWSWAGDGGKPWMAEYEDKDDVEHLQSERASAVVRVGDRVIVVGEAEVRVDNEIVPRTIVVQLTPGGELKSADTWISVGDWGGRDGARDVVALGDEYCLTGWSGAPPRALTRCSHGLQPWWSTEHTEMDTVARAISHNQRGEVVVAGERVVKGKAQVWLEALVPGGDGVAVWSFNGAPGQANGVDCGRWGPCVYVGMSGLQWMAGALTP